MSLFFIVSINLLNVSGPDQSISCLAKVSTPSLRSFTSAIEIVEGVSMLLNTFSLSIFIYSICVVEGIFVHDPIEASAFRLKLMLDIVPLQDVSSDISIKAVVASPLYGTITSFEEDVLYLITNLYLLNLGVDSGVTNLSVINL